MNDVTIMVRNLPEDIKREFKSQCAEKGKTMQDEIVRLIRAAIKDNKGKGK